MITILWASNMSIKQLNFKLQLDSELNVFMVISIPEGHHNAFVEIVERLHQKFSDVRFRIAEDYLSLFSDNYPAVIRITELVMEEIIFF